MAVRSDVRKAREEAVHAQRAEDDLARLRTAVEGATVLLRSSSDPEARGVGKGLEAFLP